MVFGIKFGQRKRKYRRAGIPGFVADFADGNRIIGGIVENVSTGGFEIVNLPKAFIAEKHIYIPLFCQVVVSTTRCWSNPVGESRRDSIM